MAAISTLVKMKDKKVFLLGKRDFLFHINKKIELINFEKNSGVGAALIAGYEYCHKNKYDIAVVMPGDAQALPIDFDKLVEPILNGRADYAKGNRLKHKN